MSPVVVVFVRCLITALLGLDVGGADATAIGAMALVVLGYATAPLVLSRALSQVSGVAASSVALSLTAVVHAPFAVPQLGRLAAAPRQAQWSLAVLGAVCTALALARFFVLIREAGPQRALAITFVNPVVAVLLGVVLLDEPLTPGLVVGLPLVLAGCVLATGRGSPEPSAPPGPPTSGGAAALDETSGHL